MIKNFKFIWYKMWSIYTEYLNEVQCMVVFFFLSQDKDFFVLLNDVEKEYNLIKQQMHLR